MTLVTSGPLRAVFSNSSQPGPGTVVLLPKNSPEDTMTVILHTDDVPQPTDAAEATPAPTAPANPGQPGTRFWRPTP